MTERAQSYFAVSPNYCCINASLKKLNQFEKPFKMRIVFSSEFQINRKVYDWQMF